MRFIPWISCVGLAVLVTVQVQADAPSFRLNSVTRTAQAFGCTPEVVTEVRALDLDPLLEWVLMRLCAVSGARPAELMDERATRSWGEVCQLHGAAWGTLLQDVEQRVEAYQLDREAPSPESRRRSRENRPGPAPTTTAGPRP